MSNLLDYLKWRGDLSFSADGLNEVDGLIFSRLSYMPFENLAESRAPLFLCLQTALKENRIKKMQRSCTDEDAQLAETLLQAPRYQKIAVSRYQTVFDAERQEQFAALTLHIPEFGTVVSYRGTDGTLVGWKEDFNMAFATFVPSQLEAVRYLTDVAAETEGNIFVCGHSKGGNLAVYASAFCPERVQERIVAVRNFDGPGFLGEVMSQPGFLNILPRTRTFVPRSSVVGVLLEHEEAFTVVESGAASVYQHNVYQWEVKRAALKEVRSLSSSSQVIDRTLKDWVTSMPSETRSRMINGLYAALQAGTQAETVREVKEHGKMNAIRAIADLDSETREVTMQAIRLLYKSLRKSFPSKELKELIEKLPVSNLLERFMPGRDKNEEEKNLN